MGIALVGYSLPSFFIGLVLIFFVVLEWGLLPFPQFVSPNEDPVKFFQTMILPWIVIAVLNAAFYVRLTRNQVLETLGEDYVRTARAKGLRERTVVVKHALRAGLTPIVTAAGLDLAYLLGGAIITECDLQPAGHGLARCRLRRALGPADHRRRDAASARRSSSSRTWSSTFCTQSSIRA